MESHFLRVQACSWSASSSSPLPSSCRALSLGLVSSAASEEENKMGGLGRGRRISIFLSYVHMIMQCISFFKPFHKSFKMKGICFLSNIISKFRRVTFRRLFSDTYEELRSYDIGSKEPTQKLPLSSISQPYKVSTYRLLTLDKNNLVYFFSSVRLIVTSTLCGSLNSYPNSLIHYF